MLTACQKGLDSLRFQAGSLSICSALFLGEEGPHSQPEAEGLSHRRLVQGQEGAGHPPGWAASYLLAPSCMLFPHRLPGGSTNPQITSGHLPGLEARTLLGLPYRLNAVCLSSPVSHPLPLHSRPSPSVFCAPWLISSGI